MIDPTQTHHQHGHSGRDRHDAPSTAVARIKDKAESTRGIATDAAHRAAQGIDANPLGILVGGIAVGVLAGTLIPRSAQEKELLAPVGKTLSARARAAFEAARETARVQLEENGLTRDAAQTQVRGLVETLTKVVQNVGAAAAKSAADKG